MAETVNIGTGKIELTIGHPTDMATQTWTNTQLALKANDTDVTTAFAGVQVQLAGKQDTVTATLPLSKSGSGTISSLWKPSTVSVGSGMFALSSDSLGTLSISLTGTESRTALRLADSNGTVRELTSNTFGGLFWNNYDVSGALNKITALIDGTSGVSSGDSAPATGPAHRIACYESNTAGYTFGTYFYGIGLVVNAVVGLGLWGGTSAAFPEQGTGSGVLPHMLVTSAGRVGIGQQNPTYPLDVTGDIRATGTIYGAVKSFDIAHPDPSKPEMRLRHWVTETDEPGGNLLYRRQVDATQGNNIIQMPDWFKHLATNVLCVASPVRHFGLCWADLDNNDSNCIILGTSKAGIYNVIVTAKRNDICATTMCPQEVEYKPAEEIPGDDVFPSHM